MNIQNKKNALLIMAATGNYLFSVGNVLLGLKKHSPNMFDDVVIYTDETATEQDKQTIQRIYPVTFKIYDYQIPNKVDRERLKHYSNMCYARFEALAHLDKYHKVFWFDTDFLITGDISGLLEYGKTGISMSIDLDPYPEGHGVHMFFVKNVPGYDMMAEAYASGLIIFTDKLKEPLKLREYLYKQLDKYSSYIKYAEQGILQLMIEDFKLKVDMFPKLIYHAFPFEDKSKARLIHLLGKSKPWQYYTGSAYKEWYENHKKWIELGGDEAYTFKKLIQSHPEAFYGEDRYQNILLMNMLSRKSENSLINNVVEIINYKRNKRKLLRYKILSNLTFGKTRAHYIRKKKDLKAKLKAVKQFLKGK